MPVYQAFILFIKSTLSAALAVLLGLLALEWLMPKAVLPFINIFVWLLPVLVLWVLFYGLTHEPVRSRMTKYLHILWVLLVSLALLGLLTLYLDNYNIKSLLLMGSAAGIMGAWLYLSISSKIE
ncbi:MAG TPA: hypothetical protein PLF71_03050 [bacterium]|nr:MAG: hypothetical protein BWY14_00253 [Parcubacteria group bacterium ADurb.Bin192]HPN15064.1 hypothetical protein [bacterium]